MAVPAIRGRLDLIGDPGLRHVEMIRDHGASVPDRVVDLFLREIARVFQARCAEIGAGEPRAGEVRIVQSRAAEIGAGEVGAIQPRFPEIAVREVGALELGSGKGRKAQGGVPQPRKGQVDRAAVDGPHLALAHAERETEQVREKRGISCAPRIPGPWAAAQDLDVKWIGRQRYARNELTNATHTTA